MPGEMKHHYEQRPLGFRLLSLGYDWPERSRFVEGPVFKAFNELNGGTKARESFVAIAASLSGF